MNATRKAPTPRPERKQKRVRGLYQERVGEPYRTKGKLAEPTLCPRCGAVYHDARWQWLPKPAQARGRVCPACKRIEEGLVAGFIDIGGEFAAAHRAEIMKLLKHQADAEGRQHPLQRIIDIEAQGDGLRVTTTGIHLARRLGEALQHAYRGKLDFHYNAGEDLLRVYWFRDAPGRARAAVK